MYSSEVNQFHKLYQRHLTLLKLQGKSKKTIEAYSRAVRCILWKKHRNLIWLFPNVIGSAKTIQKATTHMDRGGAQKAMKVKVPFFTFLSTHHILKRYLHI